MNAAPFITVLAAGRASRFGASKLDASCAGRPLGSWVLQAVADAGLAPGAVVVGPTPPSFLADWPDWALLQNPKPAAGLSASLRLAAAEASARQAGTMLLLLADMPLLDPDFLRELAAAPVPAATVYPGGRHGAPALFPSRLFPALGRLEGDHGAAKLLAGEPQLTSLQPPAGMLIDVDRRGDIAEAEKRLSSRGGV
ncbi:NTP transferase domain-containing protein [Methyloligella sp. 2.7D]|uniref:nucleotidyltransferase family protein n=1 Tax=unclassified Methyloligella TaxID=2625955 RepID=UPI00157DFE62|nr:NTP transferase domain-containing protein [Methyloligella sp. GL2]QKP78209.1 NTP transferase domain-containing protein [Methyloligella sp. GL2]